MKETLDKMSREELIKIILRGGANEAIIGSVVMDTAFSDMVKIKEELAMYKHKITELESVQKESELELRSLAEKYFTIGFY